jgi:hypothetical protein
MSHYVTAVVTPYSVVESKVELDKYLSSILSLFDENLDFPEYSRKCYCVGREAESEIKKRVDDEFGTVDDLRNSFLGLTFSDGVKVSQIQQSENISSSDKEKLDKLWQNHITPKNEARKNYFDKHPLKDKASSDCTQCKGTGFYTTTYNPNSKWDWWVIGGSWDHWLQPDEEKPELHPNNWESCVVCKGKGKIQDLEEPSKTLICNCCKGSGDPPKFSGIQESSGYNIVSPRYIECLDSLGVSTLPYAFIDAEGSWHERGRMGMFGASYDEKEKELWEKEWKSLIRSLSDNYMITFLDLHI